MLFESSFCSLSFSGVPSSEFRIPIFFVWKVSTGGSYGLAGSRMTGRYGRFGRSESSGRSRRQKCQFLLFILLEHLDIKVLELTIQKCVQNHFKFASNPLFDSISMDIF